MNRKKVGIILAIVILLAVSFYWSGEKEIVPLLPDEMSADASDLEEEIEVSRENTERKDIEKTGVSSRSDKDEQINQNNQEKEKEKEPDKTENKETENSPTNKSKKDREVKKDKYLTEETPEDKPKPVEWQDREVEKDKKSKAYLAVTCKTIHNNIELFEEDKLEVLPDDGVIYSRNEVEFSDGESVFDLLLREMKDNKIHLEFSMTPIYNSHYIEGINNIYEFDCGELSGWMYMVNGWFPNYGVSRYKLQDGDDIELIYTCDLGRDINDGNTVIQEEGEGDE